MLNINNSWSQKLQEEFAKPYFQELQSFLNSEFKTHTIYPPKDHIFNAFNLTPFENVKVVILGQDPYHGKNQAHGLAFSVLNGIKTPPSLVNIFKELKSDIGCKEASTTELTSWATQGVFLINAVLSVREGEPNSHKAKGWEIFTDSVIKKLSYESENLVFILWGKPAQNKVKLIDESKHLVLKAPHPSPLSSYRGFFDSKPFSKTNEYLHTHSKKTIEWCL
ncbi:MAG: uracil-DNA glycosylase [Helicobacteraceae bacterium]|nr:uracil-DNA glycosylase [Helicobacteraceae bacterium]